MIAVIELEEIVDIMDASIPPKTSAAFVVGDVRDCQDSELSSACEKLIAAGARYLCFWGENCERFHDICDEVIVAIEVDAVTTWHDDESVIEAAEFFRNCALGSLADGQDDDRGLVVLLGMHRHSKAAILTALQNA